ncbi:uncharacterized protein C8Q71DRAFT_724057 [Rhodofomes roseus]|uniref:Uncharacterized protein n=1 Tax=Rhodofomes roseus TaxID=34475 RepID=A0ABQ8KEQ1_9APHY|nr:uncharacterized protein C8Q71DRAFT_724057 [Rhodofomes roseus]KAH9836219.1 hypothetical protein C8Q71DRAFT_724057 [Rhodofomes roseus]
MPAKPWVTPEQHEWFQTKKEAFLGAQKIAKVTAFLTEAEAQFWEQWPELPGLFGPEITVQDLSDEQLETYRNALQKRKLQIRAKFYNDQAKTRHEKLKTLSLSAVISAGKSTSTRVPQEVEVYSKLYYRDKVKESVEEEIKNGQGSKNKNIGVVRRETALAFEAETDEVKAEVKAFVQKVKEATAAESKERPVERTPQRYQSAINDLPRFLEYVLLYLAEETGWALTVMGGGPCPEEGGAIQTFAYHVGTTDAGHNFKQTYMNYQEAVMDPYARFLKAKYPPAERARRSLTLAAESPPPANSNVPGNITTVTTPSPAASQSAQSRRTGSPENLSSLAPPSLPVATPSLPLSPVTTAPTLAEPPEPTDRSPGVPIPDELTPTSYPLGTGNLGVQSAISASASVVPPPAPTEMSLVSAGSTAASASPITLQPSSLLTFNAPGAADHLAGGLDVPSWPGRSSDVFHFEPTFLPGNLSIPSSFDSEFHPAPPTFQFPYMSPLEPLLSLTPPLLSPISSALLGLPVIPSTLANTLATFSDTDMFSQQPALQIVQHPIVSDNIARPAVATVQSPAVATVQSPAVNVTTTDPPAPSASQMMVDPLPPTTNLPSASSTSLVLSPGSRTNANAHDATMSQSQPVPDDQPDAAELQRADDQPSRPRRDRSAPKRPDADWQPSGVHGKENRGANSVPQRKRPAPVHSSDVNAPQSKRARKI